MTIPNETTDELREALARWLMDDYVDPCSPHFWNETGDAGRKDYLDEAGRILAGPLAPLLAKLRAVEALADELDAWRENALRNARACPATSTDAAKSYGRAAAYQRAIASIRSALDTTEATR